MTRFILFVLFLISTSAQTAPITTCLDTSGLNCDAFAASYINSTKPSDAYVCCYTESTSSVEVYASTCHYDCNDASYTVASGNDNSMSRYYCGVCCEKGGVCDAASSVQCDTFNTLGSTGFCPSYATGSDICDNYMTDCAVSATNPCLYKGADYECVEIEALLDCGRCEIPTITTSASTTSTPYANCNPYNHANHNCVVDTSCDGTSTESGVTTTYVGECIEVNKCPYCNPSADTTTTSCDECVVGDPCDFYEGSVLYEGECVSGGNAASGTYGCAYCKPNTDSTTSTPYKNCNPYNHQNHNCVVGDTSCDGISTTSGATTAYVGECIEKNGCPYCNPSADTTTTSCDECVVGDPCDFYEGSVLYTGECVSGGNAASGTYGCAYCKPSADTTTTSCDECVVGETCDFYEGDALYTGVCVSGGDALGGYYCAYCAPTAETTYPITNDPCISLQSHSIYANDYCIYQGVEDDPCQGYDDLGVVLGTCTYTYFDDLGVKCLICSDGEDTTTKTPNGCPQNTCIAHAEYDICYTTVIDYGTNTYTSVNGQCIKDGNCLYCVVEDVENPTTTDKMDETTTTKAAEEEDTTTTDKKDDDPCLDLDSSCADLAEDDACSVYDDTGAVSAYGTCIYSSISHGVNCLKCVTDDEADETTTTEAAEEDTTTSEAVEDDTTTTSGDPDECTDTTLPFCFGESNCKMNKRVANSLLDLCRVCAEMETDSCECENIKSTFLSNAKGNSLSYWNLSEGMQKKIVNYCWQHVATGCSGSDSVSIVNDDTCDCSALFCDNEVGQNPTEDETGDDDDVFNDNSVFSVGVRLSALITFLCYLLTKSIF